MTPSNLEILAYEHTDLGPVCLRRRELLSAPGTVITEITLDHQLLMSSRYTASEEALARVALDLHPGSELRVLVGGLGLGYTVRVEPVTFFNDLVDEERTDWLFFAR
jgi:hypothetical protein